LVRKVLLEKDIGVRTERRNEAECPRLISSQHKRSMDFALPFGDIPSLKMSKVM